MSIQVRSNEAPSTQTQTVNSVEGKEEKSSEATESAPDTHSNDSEQNEPQASGTLGKEEDGEAVNEDDSDSSDDESEKSADSENGKPKKKGGFQRRIDKLNARISVREQELEYWKQQALKGQTAEKTQSKVEDKPQVNDGKPIPEQFDSHTSYVEALTDWKTDQKLRERDQKFEQSKILKEQQNLEITYQQRVKSFAEKNQDFHEVLGEIGNVPVSATIREVVLSSESGPAIAYELAKNKVELERINKLPPIAAARELGQIEYRLSQRSSDQKVESKKITNAPKPLDPVGAGTKGSTNKSIYESGLTQKDYENIRREQSKRRRA